MSETDVKKKLCTIPDPTPDDWEAYDKGKQRIRDIYLQPEAERKIKQLVELLKL